MGNGARDGTGDDRPASLAATHLATELPSRHIHTPAASHHRAPGGAEICRLHVAKSRPGLPANVAFRQQTDREQWRCMASQYMKHVDMYSI